MKRWRVAAVAALLAAVAGGVYAQVQPLPLFTGPQDVSNLISYLNQVVNTLNQVIREGATPAGPCGGDLSGTFPNCTISTSAAINPSSVVAGSAAGGNQGAGSINAASLFANGAQINPLTAGVGVDFSSNIVTPHAIEHIQFTTAVPLTTGVTSVHKFSAASTVDNAEISVPSFACTGNPTLTVKNCHADITCATSPTTIAASTPTTTGPADLTVSSSAIAANEYVGMVQSGGTCTVLQSQITMQVHAN